MIFPDKLISETHVFCNSYNESTCMDGVTCIDKNFICDGKHNTNKYTFNETHNFFVQVILSVLTAQMNSVVV